jgi:hypothetical protein
LEKNLANNQEKSGQVAIFQDFATLNTKKAKFNRI